jgi:hypothetical protein
VRGAVGDQPTSTFVTAFEGKHCGVPVLTGHYWLQTVSAIGRRSTRCMEPDTVPMEAEGG